ncbi:MAG: hypothetical protein JJE49_10295 [Peptostreptococcaceae bacterium]|nr:hypothetical protein [Peptostreptococcaceae bacterium]
MEITKEAKQRIMASNQAYESFEQHVFTWASGRKALMREAKRILNSENPGQYSVEYISYTRLNFLSGKILRFFRILGGQVGNFINFSKSIE